MILTCATKNYSHWLELLVKSSRKSNPGQKIVAYLIMEKEDFKEYYGNEDIEYRWIPTNESLNMEINTERKVRSVLRLKSSLILWELILGKEPFLWIDADTVVLKDIDPLLNKLEEYDFLCTHRPWKNVDQAKLAAAVLGFARRPHVINFVTRACQDVWGHWEGWYSEQLHYYRNLTPDIKHYSFTEEEHSIQDNHDAMILSHHANSYDILRKLCEEKGFIG